MCYDVRRRSLYKIAQCTYDVMKWCDITNKIGLISGGMGQGQGQGQNQGSNSSFNQGPSGQQVSNKHDVTYHLIT